MKTAVTLFSVLFCLVSLAVSADIPGVIFYSKDKTVFSYDLIKKATMPGVKDAVVSGPFAVSENGKVIVFWKDNKVFAKELGKPGETYLISQKSTSTWLPGEIEQGIPRTVKNYPANNVKNGHVTTRGKLTFRMKDFPIPIAQNLAISPDGTKIAYEFPATDLAYIQVAKGDRTQVVYGNPTTWAYLPMYDYRLDTCVAVNVLSVFGHQSYDEEAIGRISDQSGVMFGNVASLIPFPPIRMVSQDIRTQNYKFEYAGSRLSYLYTLGTHHSEMIRLGVNGPSFQDQLRKYNIKRHARFPTWSKLVNWEKGKRLHANIYQTPDGWPSIDICDVNNEKSAYNPDGKKPGIYEIVFARNGKPTPLRSCAGLAWKPDGSITILSEEGQLFEVRGSLIEEMIRNSSVVQDNGRWVANMEITRKTGQGQHGRPLTFPLVGFNNVLFVEPTLVAEKVLGNKPCWTSNDSLIVRGYDNCLYFWDKGTVEKLATAMSEYYSYCEGTSAKAPQMLAVVPSQDYPGVVPEVIPTPEPTPQEESPRGNMVLEAGKRVMIKSLGLLWKNGTPGEGNKRTILLFADSEGVSANQKPIPYAKARAPKADVVEYPQRQKLIEGESGFGVEMTFLEWVLFKTEHEYVWIHIRPVGIKGELDVRKLKDDQLDPNKLNISYYVRPFPQVVVKTAQR